MSLIYEIKLIMNSKQLLIDLISLERDKTWFEVFKQAIIQVHNP